MKLSLLIDKKTAPKFEIGGNECDFELTTAAHIIMSEEFGKNLNRAVIRLSSEDTFDIETLVQVIYSGLVAGGNEVDYQELSAFINLSNANYFLVQMSAINQHYQPTDDQIKRLEAVVDAGKRTKPKKTKKK